MKLIYAEHLWRCSHSLQFVQQGRELHRGAAGCSTGEDFQSDVIDISVTALYVNLLVVGMREEAMEKELQAAASKRISNQMLLTSQLLPCSYLACCGSFCSKRDWSTEL
ncbi:hypothetical protein KY285_004109 [Solanum tuberosum]|nr:hypothetical protein KY284_002781 [Solanum tuberosum]KAH0768238.1 hypothetical protein KY285_004109 [Solanum tuberosum]